MRTLGVLLAGGRGRRLGDPMPKPLVMCGGRTLLARAFATLESLCESVVVVAPPGLELPVAAGHRVPDAAGAAGPLAGIVAGLAARDFGEAIVLAVDLPLVTSEALASLRAARGEAVCVLPAPGGVAQPLAGWYTHAAAAPLAAALAAGERSISRAILELAPRLLDDAELARLPGGVAAYLNVNTAEDLALAERLLATRSSP